MKTGNIEAEPSKHIEIEGICLNSEMIDKLKRWQEGDVQCDIDTIDDTIYHIVSSLPENVEDAWDLLHRLCLLKGALQKFKTDE